METGSMLMDRRRFVVRAACSAAALTAMPRLYGKDESRVIRGFVTSDAGRHRLDSAITTGSGRESGLDRVTVDVEENFQNIVGFGSALTDASCFLLSRMEPKQRQAFLRETYSPEGMALNMGRVAVGSSDYSRSVFNYDDVSGDVAMEHFSVAHDREYILPMLREIRGVSPALFMLASPWSPPGWMKTYGSMLGGWMLNAYLAPYALYLARFVEEYAKAGVRVDALTCQNELETDQNGSMPATFWTPEMEADFIRDHLVPTLRSRKVDTEVWLLDHNYDLWKRVRWQLRDAKLRAAVSGVAWHGYLGTPDMMSRLHETSPDLPFYWTEGGPDITEPRYATEWTRWGRIFTEALRNWCRGLITWNLMLDPEGNPNIGPFKCGGLVTLKNDGTIAESGQYWALRHFSQHVRRGAVRVGSHSDASELNHVAFRNPDNSIVLVLTNTGAGRRVALSSVGMNAELSVPENSVSTFVW